MAYQATGWQGKSDWSKKLDCFAKSGRDRHMRLWCRCSFAEVSRTLMLNPDDGMVCIVALIIHYCLDHNIRRDRKCIQQCGKYTAYPVWA